MQRPVCLKEAAEKEMKTRVLGLLIFLGLVIAELTWPNQKPTTQLIAGDYEGNAACNSCMAGVEAEYQACIGQYGEGDADCNNSRQNGISQCQSTYCITSAVMYQQTPTFDLLNHVIPIGECADDCGTVRSVCLDVSTAVFAICNATGGINCANEANRIWVDCVSGSGCPLSN